MNPLWQQKKLREFCKEKGIHITACCPIGGQDRPGSRNLVMESKVLQEIAKTRGKTVPQVVIKSLSSLALTYGFLNYHSSDSSQLIGFDNLFLQFWKKKKPVVVISLDILS